MGNYAAAAYPQRDHQQILFLLLPALPGGGGDVRCFSLCFGSSSANRFWSAIDQVCAPHSLTQRPLPPRSAVVRCTHFATEMGCGGDHLAKSPICDGPGNRSEDLSGGHFDSFQCINFIKHSALPSLPKINPFVITRHSPGGIYRWFYGFTVSRFASIGFEAKLSPLRRGYLWTLPYSNCLRV